MQFFLFSFLVEKLFVHHHKMFKNTSFYYFLGLVIILLIILLYRQYKTQVRKFRRIPKETKGGELTLKRVNFVIQYLRELDPYYDGSDPKYYLEGKNTKFKEPTFDEIAQEMKRRGWLKERTNISIER